MASLSRLNLVVSAGRRVRKDIAETALGNVQDAWRDTVTHFLAQAERWWTQMPDGQWSVQDAKQQGILPQVGPAAHALVDTLTHAWAAEVIEARRRAYLSAFAANELSLAFMKRRPKRTVEQIIRKRESTAWAVGEGQTFREAEWSEELHPRVPAGSPAGGQFAGEGYRERTSSPEFKRWFGGSKVVDAQGQPRVMFHGTGKSFQAFTMPIKGRHPSSALGFFFHTDPAAVEKFAMSDEQGAGQVMPVYLNIRNPAEYTEEEFIDAFVLMNPIGGDQAIRDRTIETSNTLIANGYDGIFIHGKGDVPGAKNREWLNDQWVAFRPEQIKSVFNKGTFNPKKKSIIEANPYHVPAGSPEGGQFAPGPTAALDRLARQYDSFDAFSKDYSINNYHGTYWHLTDDPNFQINPNQIPHDASTLASNSGTHPGLMVTTDIDNWVATLGKRPYVAQIDLSEMQPGVGYWNVRRGFGHEIWVNDPGAARVVKVMPLAQARRVVSRLYSKQLPQSAEELRRIYDRVHAKRESNPYHVPAGSPEGGQFASADSAEPRIFKTPADVKPINDWGQKKWGWTDRPGMLLTGEPVSKDQLPNVLYHATVHLDALRTAPLLLGAKGDEGLGGGVDPGVSLTSRRADAELIQRTMTQAVVVLNTPDTVDDVRATLSTIARDDEKIGGLPAGTLDRAVEFAVDGYDVNKRAAENYAREYNEPLTRTAISSMHDAFNGYLQIRDSDAGKALYPNDPEGWRKFRMSENPLRNPLLFGDEKKLATLQPSDIGIIEVPRANIPDGVLITTGSDDWLHEVRIYGDVPLRHTRRESARALFASLREVWDETLHPRDETGKFTDAGGDRSGGKIDTPEFKAWFGDWSDPYAFSSRRDPSKPPVSYVVDKQGKPLVVYHATNQDITSFETGRATFDNWGLLGNIETQRHAIFASDSPDVAAGYVAAGTERSEGARIMPLYLQMAAPLDLDSYDAFHYEDDLRAVGINPSWIHNAQQTWEILDGEQGREVVANLKRAGFDGVIFNENGHRTYAVFDPEQIKSVWNKGAFSPASKSIIEALREAWDEDLHPRDERGRFADVGAAVWSDSIPTSEGISAAEENWAGGVADFGDPEAATLIQDMPDYPEYAAALHAALRAQVGDSVTMYRAMTSEQVDDWASGADMGPLAFTLDRKWAESWHKFAGNVGKTFRIVRASVPVNAVIMRGKEEESELVVDGNQVSFHALKVMHEAWSEDLHPRDDHGKWVDAGGATNGSGQHKTDTPEFQRWFAGSKVVDDSGKPLVVYHGTKADISEFKPHEDQTVPGAFFFTSNPEYASGEAGKRLSGSNVMPVYLALKNPLVVDYAGKPWDGDRRAVEKAQAGGHDGLIRKNMASVLRNGMKFDEYVVFNPQQIKSIWNKGRFNPHDPHISESLREANADPVIDDAIPAIDRERILQAIERFIPPPWRRLPAKIRFRRPDEDEAEFGGIHGTWTDGREIVLNPAIFDSKEKFGRQREAEFDPEKHPREPAGGPDGGHFVPSVGGGGRAPAGGVWLSSFGTEVFYAGGQFLPEELPAKQGRKAKNLALRAASSYDKYDNFSDVTVESGGALTKGYWVTGKIAGHDRDLFLAKKPFGTVGEAVQFATEFVKQRGEQRTAEGFAPHPTRIAVKAKDDG